MPRSHSHSSRGCASCGGTSYRPPAPSVPTYDRCIGGLSAPPAAKEAPCGCQRGGSSARPTPGSAAPTKNYNKDDCPTWAISCETKQALRDCARTALCDFLECLAETLCPDGKFDLEQLKERNKDRELQTELINCVGQLACSFMHCLPDALCPPDACEAETPVDCLPCGYAVEVLQ